MCKEYVNATVRELEEWPDTSMTQEPQGKHSKLVLHYKDQSRLIVMATTPSDARGLQNHIATVRRELRGMGASKRHVIVGKPKAERPFKPHQPATQAPFKELEITMAEQPKTAEQKFTQILTAISDLRYGEMLRFADALSAAAIETKMQRNRPHDWARMLQALIETETELAA